MNSNDVSPYMTRMNLNGTFDAICCRCSTTSAAYVPVEEELARWHAKHSCDDSKGLSLVTARR